MQKISTAVIPIAGFGTRMYPYTLFTNKAFLPVGKKPIIIHILEEAVNADIYNFIIIINESQKSIKDSLRPQNDQLNNEEVIKFNNLINSINISYIIQKEQNGLAAAILKAKSKIDDEYFAVMLGDCSFIPNNSSYGIGELVNHFRKSNNNYIGLTKIESNKLKNYGVINGNLIDDKLVHINNIIEKPTFNPPSNLICAGRYIFSKSIIQLLENSIKPYEELLLPNVINLLAISEKVFGVIHSTWWLDVGNELEFIKANLNYGLSIENYNKEISNIRKKPFIN